MSILMFLVKKIGKNFIPPKTYYLIGHCNYSSSLYFNQFHPILFRSENGIFVIKFMNIGTVLH